MTTVSLRSAELIATVAARGAELSSLRDAAGRELMWSGDPAVWAGRAPILFPVIGVVADGVVRVDGRAYPMPKHGVVRRRDFAVVDRDEAGVTFRLDADAETRAAYPFDFRLDIRFTLTGATLAMTATVSNRGQRPMPASFGFHPAFAWPLPYGRPRAAHRIVFARPEPAPIRRVDTAGQLRPAALPSPIDGRVLALDDSLFADDAVILDRPASRTLRYGADDGPQLALAFDLPMLGLWTKPGAPFLCIEPWQGLADPQGFSGDLAEKPGGVILAPGEARAFSLSVTLAP